MTTAHQSPSVMEDDEKMVITQDEQVTNEGSFIDENHHVDQFGTEDIHDAATVRLRRKLDTRIVPILWCMYFLNYLDRSAIAQARLNGLETSLNLVDSQYNVCVSILFAGYTIAQIPSNYIMASGKVRPALWMSSFMMLWGMFSTRLSEVSHHFCMHRHL
jgi:hypothetical protein